MLSLPSLAPQDSYSLWYTSSASSNLSQYSEGSHPNDTHATSHSHVTHQHGHRRHNNIHRSPLARLRHDEETIEQRKLHIQNYGNSWLKPPGLPKTLYQQREEKREAEEHQEALRREALAQELAEAEAAEDVDELLQGEGMDGEDGEARDLDDDVPHADTTGMGAMDDSDDEEDENEGDSRLPGNSTLHGSMDDTDDRIEIGQQRTGPMTTSILVAQAREARAEATSRLPARLPDDVYREAIARGEDAGASGFGEDDGSIVDEGDQSQILQEEDLVHDGMDDMDMDMDADLDADIPEAEDAGGYEHTDTEEELSSSDDESVDAGRLPTRRTVANTSMIRSDGTQTSMDLSSIMSAGSSQIGSSPQQRSGFRGRHSGL